MAAESVIAPPRRPGAGRKPDLPLRTLSGFEEEYVESCQQEANTARLCNQVLARCLVPPGADWLEALERVRALPVSERDLALIELRRRSLGDEVRTAAACPRCRATQELAFSLGSLPLGLDTPPERIECTLSSGAVAVLRLPTAGDQERLLDEPDLTPARRRTLLLSRAIERLGGESAPFEEDRVRALESRVRHELEDAIERSLPDSNLSMHVTCAQCGSEFDAPFDVGAFFLPK